MKVIVKYLALHKELVGKSSEEFEMIKDSTLGELLIRLVSIYPCLRDAESETAISLNGMLADRGKMLSEGDVVAVFPVVTGG